MKLVSVYNKDGGVTKPTLKLLYKLLEQRKPYQNISHKQMPKWEEHCTFVRNQPYKHWYLIKYQRRTVGAVYISRADEIGIFLLDEYQHRGIGKEVLQNLYVYHQEIEYFYANIAPFNTASLAFFLNRQYQYKDYMAKKGKVLQYTFCKPNPYYVPNESSRSSNGLKAELVK